MAEIGFYHLTRTAADLALPALLGRTLALGKRALVLCGSAERVAALDAALWLCTEPDWLPHGTARMGNPQWQPVWLTDGVPDSAEAVANGATFLFMLDGMVAPAEWFERVFDLFDGNDGAAVAAARERWRAAKAAGHTLTYWRQGARGWERQGA